MYYDTKNNKIFNNYESYTRAKRDFEGVSPNGTVKNLKEAG